MIKSAYRFCGFTLIELLIVIAIIGTMIAILLPQLTNFNRDQVFKNTTSDLRSNIRKTQNNASSGLNCNIAGLAAKQWAIDFTQNATTYNITATCSDDTTPSQTYQFSPGIQISDIQFDTTSCNQASVIFKNVSSAISFATSDAGCLSLTNGNKVSIFLNNASVVGTGTTVVIEKGGTVY